MLGGCRGTSGTGGGHRHGVGTRCKKGTSAASNQILFDFLLFPSLQFYRERLHLNFTAVPTRVNCLREAVPL